LDSVPKAIGATSIEIVHKKIKLQQEKIPTNHSRLYKSYPKKHQQQEDKIPSNQSRLYKSYPKKHWCYTNN
jgi:hypothetical protein